MPELDTLDNELALLDQAFEDRLQRMPSVLAGAARSLPDRLRIRPDRPSSWTARLSPVVVLHPMLQTEGCAEVEREHARQATLAHLFLLAHAFADDHLTDGQSGLTRADFVFVKEAVLEAEEVLTEMPGAPAIAREELRRALRRHHRGQITRFERSADQRRTLVADRAALGAVAGRVLLRAARVPDDRIALLDEAFEALVVALQWEDDIHDWPSDLAGGQDNLLLALLAESGVAPAADTNLVEAELIDHGIYETAFRLFAEEMDRARDPQVTLGNRRLDARLAERRRDLEALAIELRNEIGANRRDHAAHSRVDPPAD